MGKPVEATGEYYGIARVILQRRDFEASYRLLNLRLVNAKITLSMQSAITTQRYPLRFISTLTSKGQMTVPLVVRRRLQSNNHRKIEIVVEPDGTIRLAKPRFTNIDSIAGSIPPLSKPLTKQEMREAVAEDFADRYLAKHGQ